MPHMACIDPSNENKRHKQMAKNDLNGRWRNVHMNKYSNEPRHSSEVLKFGPSSVSCHNTNNSQIKKRDNSREHTHSFSSRQDPSTSIQHNKFDLIASQNLASGYDCQTRDDTSWTNTRGKGGIRNNVHVNPGRRSVENRGAKQQNYCAHEKPTDRPNASNNPRGLYLSAKLHLESASYHEGNQYCIHIFTTVYTKTTDINSKK